METMATGARVVIGAGSRNCVIDAAGGSPALQAALVIRREGKPVDIRKAAGGPPWKLDLPEDADAKVDIILYMSSETEQGRVEDRSPITCRIGDSGFQLAPRTDRHGAMILAEVYTRNGSLTMRVRGDGYLFGIKALARKEGIPVEPFLPKERGYEGGARHPEERHAPSRPGGGAIGSGSGVVVARDHVITNAHVVNGSREQTVHGQEGDIRARVLAIDEQHDLALLRAPGIGGTPIPIRPMGTLYLGEAVIAAGYPLRDVLGDDLKMTHGNVSGMNGQNGIVSAFQFSAPIGSGSSGGAVTDINGNLVGIVAAALAHDAMRQRGAISENTNFAVKASLVAEMMAAHQVEWSGDAATAATPSEVSKAIRRSVVSITLS